MTILNQLLLVSCFLYHGNGDKISTVFEWKRMEFEYDKATKAAHLKSGFYNPDIPTPIDVDVHYVNEKRRVFVTIPRFSIGSPITLGEVAHRKNKFVLVPYPSIEWHDNPSECKKDRLLSVFRTKIDQCARMWVLDSGRYDDEVICSPQLLAFNLKTNAIEYRFEFPKKLYSKDSTFVNSAVEVPNGKCNDTFVYMSDTTTYALAVYSTRTGKSWLVKDRTMAADPKFSTITIQGTSFDLSDGIMGMDLEPIKRKNRKLFYSSLMSNTLNYVSSSNLRNEHLFQHSPKSSPQLFSKFPTGRPSQSAGMSIDKDGIAYFGLMSESSINCWNTKSSDYGQYISTVYANDTTLQFPSGVKVINKGQEGEELWVLSSRLQKLMTDTFDFNDVNFRISYGKIPDVLKGTKCKNPNNT